MSEEQVPAIEGMERHHRRKGDRADWRPVNIIYLTPEDHAWAEAHPEEARELGWSVSRYEDPEDVPVIIPKALHREAKPREKRKEKARSRGVISMRPPKDEKEDGAGVWDDYMKAGRKLGARAGMSWSETVPDYTVACWLIGIGIRAAKDEIEYGGESC